MAPGHHHPPSTLPPSSTSKAIDLRMLPYWPPDRSLRAPFSYEGASAVSDRAKFEKWYYERTPPSRSYSVRDSSEANRSPEEVLTAQLKARQTPVYANKHLIGDHRKTLYKLASFMWNEAGGDAEPAAGRELRVPMGVAVVEGAEHDQRVLMELVSARKQPNGRPLIEVRYHMSKDPQSKGEASALVEFVRRFKPEGRLLTHVASVEEQRLLVELLVDNARHLQRAEHAGLFATSFLSPLSEEMFKRVVGELCHVAAPHRGYIVKEYFPGTSAAGYPALTKPEPLALALSQHRVTLADTLVGAHIMAKPGGGNAYLGDKNSQTLARHLSDVKMSALGPGASSNTRRQIRDAGERRNLPPGLKALQ